MRLLPKSHQQLFVFQVYINWMNFTINLLAPLVTLFAMNLAIYRVLRKLRTPASASSSSDHRRGSSLFRRQHHQDQSPQQQQQRGGSTKKKLLVHLRGRAENEDPTRRSQGPSQGGFNGGRTKEERERDASYTRASILMVVVFIVCHSPRLITNTVELFVDQADLPMVSSAQRSSRLAR